jgi:hypothetical protein
MILYLYYGLALSLSLGALTKITIIPPVNIYLFDLISTLIIILSIKKVLKVVKKLNIFTLLFALFSIISLIGLSINTRGVFEFSSSITYLIRLGVYLLLIIPIISLKQDSKNKLKKIMLVSVFIFILFGYLQYFYYPDLRNLYYLGWDEHLYRLFSTFLDPNFTGVFIALIILFYSGLFFQLFKKSGLVIKALLVSGYLFIVPSLFLTYSRSSLITGIFSMLLLLFINGKKKIVVYSVIIFLVLLVLLPRNLGGEGVNLLRTSTITARAVEYNNSFKIFLDNPVFGIGFNSLRFASARYGFVDSSLVLASHSSAGVPNSFLVILATTGIVGFIIFILFILNTLKYAWNIESKIDSSVLTAMFAAVLLDSLFENALLFSPIILFLVLSFGVLRGKLR